MNNRALLRMEDGAAAAEMALLTPIFLVLLLGSIELGHYFYQEHKLVQSVRDAARFAARQGFENYTVCNATPGGTVNADSLQVARTGQASGGADRLPNWDSATWTTTTLCSTGATTGTTTISYAGIYTGSTGGARVVEVSADLAYTSIFGLVGLSGTGMRLRAVQKAAVAGI